MYYFLIRIDFLNQSLLRDKKIEKKFSILYNFFEKFNIFLILICFVYLSFIHYTINLPFILGGLISIVLFVIIVSLKMKYPSF